MPRSGMFYRVNIAMFSFGSICWGSDFN
ncbi:hypothetical protein NC652_033223 [Populus alba x Populus x berolinensis]|uniref:Uncharacterized protein n=1 Tax=Populus alba x Populus x berolinensis TaxID=444605 RepID=A0AAD6Q0K8_9ROSI|nr:hypothetical protein NC652_033223 [Populus alba x Populus x berolinensis]KAJ6972788.1 hypothetical protein NC653_033183 [Populus alba x Populus x berolinensis]